MTIAGDTTRAIEESRPVDLPPPSARKAIRQTGRLSQAQVGEIVGVTGQMVGLWEMGRNEPTGKRRARYAEFLHTCMEASR